MKTSLSRENIEKLDRSGMMGLLLDFPDQCRVAEALARKARFLFEKRDFTKIVFAGLGGSAIGADLVRSYLYFESKVPIVVLREYQLPAYVDDTTLVIVSSYSGNTEETLSAYKEAREKKATLLAVSSGGSLKDFCARDKVTFVEIPRNLPPRCSLGYLSIIPLCLLSRLGLASDPHAELHQMIETLEDLKRHNLNPGITQKENIAKSVALKLYNKMCFIYAGSVHFDVCAIRWRGQIAENSKALSSSHVFPEMNHNEIVGWVHPEKQLKNFVAVMLRDSKMHARVSLRMDITARLIKKEGVEVIEVASRGEGLLSHIFSLIYIGDFVSFYLAILYGIDPTPVDRVTYLKEQLAKK